MTRIDRSRIGTAIVALYDAPDLCEAVGVPTMYYRVFAFAMACFFAGVAGAVYGSFNPFLHPESFTIIQSIETVSFVIIGGAASVWGPILGVFVVKGIAMGVRGLGAYEIIISGLMMIFVMLVIPEGLVGPAEAGEAIPDAARGRRTDGAEPWRLTGCLKPGVSSSSSAAWRPSTTSTSMCWRGENPGRNRPERIGKNHPFQRDNRISEGQRRRCVVPGGAHHESGTAPDRQAGASSERSS